MVEMWFYVVRSMPYAMPVEDDPWHLKRWVMPIVPRKGEAVRVGQVQYRVVDVEHIAQGDAAAPLDSGRRAPHVLVLIERVSRTLGSG